MQKVTDFAYFQNFEKQRTSKDDLTEYKFVLSDSVVHVHLNETSININELYKKLSLANNLSQDNTHENKALIYTICFKIYGYNYTRRK